MKAVIICGPTGSGKSSLALSLAEKFKGVIINADSVQIYREIKILSGRPTSDDYRQAPHRLYGVMPIFKPCTLGIWRKMALEMIKECELSGHLPILCGGTGLYIKFLLNELSPIPDIPPSIKLEAREKLEELGNENFRELLFKNDPVSACRIKLGDTNRLLRAWEVFIATTKPLSYWHKQSRETGSQDKFFKVCLMPEREVLYSKCDKRFLDFVEMGAIEEAQALEFITASPELPASKTLGLLELIKYTKGELELSEAIEQAQRTTRRYAKRQLTWFRHQLDEDFLIQNLCCRKTQSDCFKKIVNFLG